MEADCYLQNLLAAVLFLKLIWEVGEIFLLTVTITAENGLLMDKLMRKLLKFQ